MSNHSMLQQREISPGEQSETFLTVVDVHHPPPPKKSSSRKKKTRGALPVPLKKAKTICHESPAKEDGCAQKLEDGFDQPWSAEHGLHAGDGFEDFTSSEYLDLLLGAAAIVPFAMPLNKDSRDNWDRLLGCDLFPLDLTLRKYIVVGLNPNTNFEICVRLFGDIQCKKYVDIIDITKFVAFLVKIQARLKLKCDALEKEYIDKCNGLSFTLLDKFNLKCCFGDGFLVLSKFNMQNLISLENKIINIISAYKMKYENIQFEYKKFLQNTVIGAVRSEIESELMLFKFINEEDDSFVGIFKEMFIYYNHKMNKDLRCVDTFITRENKCIV